MKRKRSSKRKPPGSKNSSPNWGEFLDTEWYDRPPPTATALRDGWRDRAPDAVLIERLLVERLAQPDRINTIRLRETDQVDVLIDDLRFRGFSEPMIVVVDVRGRMVLKDGHHRLLAATVLGIDRVPVRFRRSERVSTSGGAAAQDMIPLLMHAHVAER